MPRNRSLQESIDRITDRRGPDECWPWTGSKNTKGYARLARRLPTGRLRYYAVSRLVWERHNGLPFPEGLLACHSCDNPSCVNPAHIWPGTNAENMRDRVAKGRANTAGLMAAAKSTAKSIHDLNGSGRLITVARLLLRYVEKHEQAGCSDAARLAQIARAEA